jgi:hypothetical protein
VGNSENVADRLERAVRKGTDSAEEIHRKVANLPLDLLERIELLEESVQKVRQIQDEAIGAIYDLVRGINQEIGRAASDIIENGNAAGDEKSQSSEE